MELCDTNQVIAKIVKRGCQDLANFIRIEYSDDILNRTYENISNLPNDLLLSIQNLLDKTELHDEEGYFKTTHEECEICIRTITNAIEICFFNSLQGMIDSNLWKSVKSETPDIDILCFKDQPFLCEGETCDRTHIATDMTHYGVVDGKVVEFT